MARLFRKILFLLLVLCNHIALSAETAKVWELTPFRILPSTNDQLEVSFLNVCGGEFAGFLAKVDPDQNLHLGVLLRRSNRRCTALRGMAHTRVPAIKPSSFKKIVIMTPFDVTSTMQLTEVQTYSQSRAENQDSLELVYTSNCTQNLGAVFREEALGLRIGVLEAVDPRLKNCLRSSKIMELKGFPFISPRRILLNGFEVEASDHPPFRLVEVGARWSPTQPTNQALSDHTVRVNFLRKCYDSPIGLIRRQNSRDERLSMLLARYEGIDCGEKSLRSVWTYWDEKLPTDTKRTLFVSQSLEDQRPITLSRPLSYEWLRKGSRTFLSLTAYEGCAPFLGLVTRKSQPGTALGILHKHNEQPCKSKIKKVRYTYEWTHETAFDEEVKPLRLISANDT